MFMAEKVDLTHHSQCPGDQRVHDPQMPGASASHVRTIALQHLTRWRSRTEEATTHMVCSAAIVSASIT